MRRFAFFAAALAACCVSGRASAQDCPPENSREFRFQALGLYWNRTDNQRMFDWLGSPQDRFAATNDLFLEAQPGLRLQAGYENYRVGVTASYTEFTTFETFTTRTLFSPLSFDRNPGGALSPMNISTRIEQAAVQEENVLGATRINTAEQLLGGATWDAFYESRWRDGDANVMFRPWADKQFTIGFGIRGGNLKERMGLEILGTFDDPITGDDNNEELLHSSLINTDVVVGNVNNTIVGGALTHVSGGGTGFQGDIVGGVAATASILAMSYDTRVENDLLGPQFILDTRLCETRYFAIDGILRAGVFYNKINARLTETYIETNLDQDVYRMVYEDQRSTVAFLGNVGLSGGYRLTQNITLKGGYEMQLMSGVAIASEQWEHVTTDNCGCPRYELQSDGIIILHGLTGGVDVVW